jgi:hypothetical protein
MPINPHVAEEFAQIARRQGQLNAFERDYRSPSPRREELVAVQAEYDPTYRDLGATAPPPGRPGEGVREFRGRLLSALLPYTQNYRDSDAFALAGTPVEAEVKREIAANIADRRRGNDDGSLRKVETVENGVTRIEWRGRPAPVDVAVHGAVPGRDRDQGLRQSGNETLPVWRWGSPPTPMTDPVVMDRVEAEAWLRADHAGDRQAKNFWSTLFDDGSECFLCGKPTADRKVSLISDPVDATRTIVVPYCLACFAMPTLYRCRLEMKMLKQVWPNAAWTFNRPAPKRPAGKRRRR